MKWFKHYSNAHKGGVLQDLYAEFGINAGHGIYFRLIEFLADKWDGKSEPKFRFFAEILRNHLHLTPKNFRNLVEILKKSPDISFELSENFCDITLPKLLEIRHRDALDAGTRQALCQHENGGDNNKNRRDNNTIGNSDFKKPTDSERSDKQFDANGLAEVERILKEAHGQEKAPTLLARKSAQILATFGDPGSFRDWANGVLSGKNCPDIETKPSDFAKYFSKALSNALTGAA